MDLYITSTLSSSVVAPSMGLLRVSGHNLWVIRASKKLFSGWLKGTNATLFEFTRGYSPTQKFVHLSTFLNMPLHKKQKSSPNINIYDKFEYSNCNLNVIRNRWGDSTVKCALFSVT